MDLYKIISKQVKNSGITYTILSLDNSISVEDIVHDIYLSVCNDNCDYIHRKINQILIDIYRKKKIRKMDYCEINDDILSKGEHVESIIIKESLSHLDKIDNNIKDYVYDYFINNMTYKEISDKNGIPLNTIKRKIDKGLEKIKEYYKED